MFAGRALVSSHGTIARHSPRKMFRQAARDPYPAEPGHGKWMSLNERKKIAQCDDKLTTTRERIFCIVCSTRVILFFYFLQQEASAFVLIARSWGFLSFHSDVVFICRCARVYTKRKRHQRGNVSAAQLAMARAVDHFPERGRGPAIVWRAIDAIMITKRLRRMDHFVKRYGSGHGRAERPRKSFEVISNFSLLFISAATYYYYLRKEASKLRKVHFVLLPSPRKRKKIGNCLPSLKKSIFWCSLWPTILLRGLMMIILIHHMIIISRRHTCQTSLQETENTNLCIGLKRK